MSDKILSIIVPSYNMEAYLPKCLGSLVIDDKDLFQKLDVIVVNDGSNDRTSEIAHEFEEKYPGVFQVIDKPNGHYGSCINAALPIAKGTYVKVLDADDWFDTSNFKVFLLDLSDLVNKNVVPDVVFTDFSVVDALGSLRKIEKFSFPEGNIFQTGDTLKNMRFIYMHAVAYRTSILHAIGYEQSVGIMYTDTEWVTYPIPYLKTAIYFPIAVYSYLIGREGQSMDVSVQLRNGRMLLQIANRLNKEVRKDNLPKDVCEFYMGAVNRIVRAAYSFPLFYASREMVDVGIEQLNKDIDVSFPELRNISEKISFPSRKGLRVIYIWRKYPYVRGVLVRVLRLYSRMMGYINKRRNK